MIYYVPPSPCWKPHVRLVRFEPEPSEKNSKIGRSSPSRAAVREIHASRTTANMLIPEISTGYAHTDRPQRVGKFKWRPRPVNWSMRSKSSMTSTLEGAKELGHTASGSSELIGEIHLSIFLFFLFFVSVHHRISPDYI